MKVSAIFKIQLLCILCIFLGSACSGGGNAAKTSSATSENAPLVNDSLDDLRIVDGKSAYADVMPGCVIIIRASDSCTLKTLPLLGHEFENPSIDDVMSRVLVSHDWMATRFREVLNVLPADILTLFKATTAIVIDADVRPSHYTPRTGAIYIDPEVLWLNNDEKNAISKAKDFRSDFGNGLQFENVSRYVKGNKKAYKNYSLNSSATRELDDIIYLVASVLYHELSHANDSFPLGTHSALNSNKTVYQAYLDNMQPVARALSEKLPLKNEFLFDMAQILKVGMMAGESQKEVTGEYVGSQLEGDGANDIYSYVSKETSLSVAVLREDVAMLFEEAMMKYHFDLDRDVAFLWKNPVGEKCNDFTIQWGQRSRIGDPKVSERAHFVVNAILPEANVTTFFETLSAPQALPTDVGWCSVLEPDGKSMVRAKSALALFYGVKEESEPMTDRLHPGL